MTRSRFACCAAVFFTSLLVVQVQSGELIVDREVTVHSARQVETRRRELIAFLWGAAGFPKNRLPDTILTNVASPVKQLNHLDRVDELRMRLAPGLEGLA